MKKEKKVIINSCCESSYKKQFVFTNDNVQNIANSFLSYVLSCEKTVFSTDNNYQFDILLCDNDFIHNINKEYRQKDCPTDVITFALYFDSDEKIIVDNNISLGQIIISCDKVFEQAKENNVTPEYEFKNLLAHGILHLLGYDHLSDETLNIMLELQSKMIEEENNVKV